MSEDSIERDGIKWGADIVVDGKRPEWLNSNVAMMWAVIENNGSYGVWCTTTSDDTHNWRGFGNGVAIRLPADHPYYAQEKLDIDPALVERMVALVRRLATELMAHTNAIAEARAILKALEPIDPDLLEARRCVVMAYEGIGRKDLALQADSGKMDSRLRVQACLSAIKRGRELETNA